MTKLYQIPRRPRQIRRGGLTTKYTKYTKGGGAGRYFTMGSDPIVPTLHFLLRQAYTVKTYGSSKNLVEQHAAKKYKLRRAKFFDRKYLVQKPGSAKGIHRERTIHAGDSPEKPPRDGSPGDRPIGDAASSRVNM